MTKRIRILVIEDNRLLRDGMAAMLKEQTDFQVIGAVGSSETVLPKIRALKLNVVLLDVGLRSQNSLEIVRSFKERSPEVKLIAMHLVPTQADVLDFVKAGVSGLIVKDATISDFHKTIRTVARGGKVLPLHLTESLFSQIVERAINTSGAAKLAEAVRMTKRERQVIDLISEGLMNKEIATRLHLSTYTVKSHVHNILEKMAMHSRAQIAKYAHDAETVKTASNSISLIDS